MRSPRFAKQGLLAVGVVLSIVVALKISAPKDGLDASAAPQPPPLPAGAQAAVAVPAAALGAEAPLPLVRLTGVVLGQRGERAALVAINNAPPVMVRIGDTLGGASTVLAMGDDWLAFSHGTAVMRVRTQDGEAPATPAGNRVAAAVPVMPAAPQASPQPDNGNEEFRQAMKQKLASIKP